MVTSFTDLGVKFIKQFLTSKKIKYDFNHMLTIRHAKGEGLQNYLSHFNARIHNIDNCEQPFAMATLKAGLFRGPFLHSITKNKPKDHIELLAKANKYILIEDLDKFRHELRALIEPQL